MTSLYPEVVSVISVTRTSKPPKEQSRESLNLWPHVVLHLYPDRTAGAESPLRDADWSRLEQQARERLEQLLKDVGFIERWLATEKRASVELRV